MKKLLFLAVLIFCLLGTTQTAYSYFDNSTTTILDEDGELYKIEESTSSSTKNLVPLGAVLGVNDTYYMTYQYDVYIEKGISVDSVVKDLTLEGSTLTENEMNNLFNFEIKVDHVKDVQLSNGLFSTSTDGELIHITIEITMNNLDSIDNPSTIFGHNLSFTYLLTVSKA